MKKFLLSFLLFLCVLALKAQEGFPDPAYGTGGILTTEPTTHGAFDGSGRLVVGRYASNVLTFTRYTANGTLDASFDNGGSVQHDITSQGVTGGTLNSFGQTSDGKVVIVLERTLLISPFPLPQFYHVIMRFGADGNIDPSFGSGGRIWRSIGNLQRPSSSPTTSVLSNEQILYTDFTAAPGGGSYTRILYTADGRSTIPLSSTAPKPQPFYPIYQIDRGPVPGAFFVQPDGKMIATNSYDISIGLGRRINAIVINRLHPDGTLDTSFGDNGAIQFEYLSNVLDRQPGVPTQLFAVQPDGQLLMATQYRDSILRINTSGAIDPGFAFVPPSWWSGFLWQPDGKIIISGRSGQAGDANNFTVARYHPDGTPDPSFGSGGVTVTPLDPALTASTNALVGNRLYVFFNSPNTASTLHCKAIAYQLSSVPYMVGEGCPRDTLITLSSCSATTAVTWPVPLDSFPAIISIPSGFYPDGTPYDGEGRLTLLGTFGGHGYYRSGDALQSYSWETANQIALSKGGHLTTITSEAENAFITSRVQSNGYFSWLGLRRTGAGPTQFAWVTGEPLSYTNWGAEDPNNLSGYEPYVFMYEGFGKWHDLIEFLLPFQVEYNQAPIRWRQISGPAKGSSLAVGVYPVCYERFNAITNQKDTCCFTIRVQCSTPTTAPMASVHKEAEGTSDMGFSVKALPNPSSTSFTLQLSKGNSKERISIRVMDISGRVIETRDGVAPTTVLQLGSIYHPGTYLVHLQQGAKRTSLKLVKQPR